MFRIFEGLQRGFVSTTPGRIKIVRPTPAICTAAALALLGALSTPAIAGDVSGTIALGKSKPKPPVRSTGFVERKPNPIMETLRFDPRREIVVVLEGGPMQPADQEPDRNGVKWQLMGESFDIPVLPIVAGTDIDLKYTGHGSPTLYSPQDEALLKSEAISRDGIRTLSVKEPGKAFEIRARGSQHLVGRIVAFKHRFFARLDGDGNFEIKDVPEGTWTLKLWYRDGWVDGVATAVEVTRRDRKVDPINVPDSVGPDAPAPKPESEGK